MCGIVVVVFMKELSSKTKLSSITIYGFLPLHVLFFQHHPVLATPMFGNVQTVLHMVFEGVGPDLVSICRHLGTGTQGQSRVAHGMVKSDGYSFNYQKTF